MLTEMIHVFLLLLNTTLIEHKLNSQWVVEAEIDNFSRNLYQWQGEQHSDVKQKVVCCWFNLPSIHTGFTVDSRGSDLSPVVEGNDKVCPFSGHKCAQVKYSSIRLVPVWIESHTTAGFNTGKMLWLFHHPFTPYKPFRGPIPNCWCLYLYFSVSQAQPEHSLVIIFHLYREINSSWT